MELDVRKNKLESMFRGCPDLLTIKEAVSWSPFGKNQIYELIKSKTLKSHYVHGAFMITKIELIDYLLAHCDDESPIKMIKEKRSGGDRA